MVDADHVVLLDDHGSRIGTAAKSNVHTLDTPLHLAFSCHVIDDEGRLLVTRRAISKVAWPGVWTNSFCGHPRPDEDPVEAVHRRAQFELGLTITDVELALPNFRYRAVDASGIVENEICPVYTARASGSLALNPLEVEESRWVDAAQLAVSIQATPWAFSPWLVLQAAQLPLLADPLLSAGPRAS